jgi:hypothetical protein
LIKRKDSIALRDFVKNIVDALEARTHMLREWALHWVLAPILYFLTLSCMGLVVADACGWIHPMRDGLLSIIKIILGGEAISGSAGAGFGWLFHKKIARYEFKLGHYRQLWVVAFRPLPELRTIHGIHLEPNLARLLTGDSKTRYYGFISTTLAAT